MTARIRAGRSGWPRAMCSSAATGPTTVSTAIRRELFFQSKTIGSPLMSNSVQGRFCLSGPAGCSGGLVLDGEPVPGLEVGGERPDDGVDVGRALRTLQFVDVGELEPSGDMVPEAHRGATGRRVH